MAYRVLQCAGLLSRGKIVASFIISLLLVSFSFAQSHEWSVRLASGEVFERVALTRLTADSLVITEGSGYAEWLLIDKIAQLRKEKRSAILPSAIIGGVGGGVTGYSMRPTARYQTEANLYSVGFGMLVGAGVGYLVGSLIQSDEVIDLRQLDRQAKADRLKALVQQE